MNNHLLVLVVVIVMWCLAILSGFSKEPEIYVNEEGQVIILQPIDTDYTLSIDQEDPSNYEVLVTPDGN